MNGKEKLRFDLASRLSRWSSKDGSLELFYLPTWRSDLDTGGFFFLVLGNEVGGEGRLLDFKVRSLGEGSQRWFAIDARQEVSRLIPRLIEALKSPGP